MRFSLANAVAREGMAFDPLPQIPLQAASGSVPNDAECFALWDKYDMLPNVREHSLLVAHIATRLASDLFAAGYATDCAAIRASSLLHDIAKTYCLRKGGGHAQIGAAWVVSETHNYAVAQGVFLHIWWPWPLPDKEILAISLPLIVLYADKRARHNTCVSLAERFEDLFQRYGTCRAARDTINASFVQCKAIEDTLSELLGRDLNEDTFDSGRMVQ